MSATCLVLTRQNTGNIEECGGKLTRVIFDFLAPATTMCRRCGDVRVTDGITPERSGLPPDAPEETTHG